MDGLPLVCGRGQPTVAVMRLLDLLRAAGAHLRYHGDFDWPGLMIANRVLRRTGASPWRYGTADYLAAAGRARAPLTGPSVPATWDDTLRPAMERAQVQVEEDIVDDLLGDIAR